MADTISKIVDKISSYQLFNYFFPGVIFNFVVDQSMSFKIAPEDILYRIFIYYVTGMILSRMRVCHKSVTHPFLCVFLYILVES